MAIKPNRGEPKVFRRIFLSNTKNTVVLVPNSIYASAIQLPAETIAKSNSKFHVSNALVFSFIHDFEFIVFILVDNIYFISPPLAVLPISADQLSIALKASKIQGHCNILKPTASKPSEAFCMPQIVSTLSHQNHPLLSITQASHLNAGQ